MTAHEMNLKALALMNETITDTDLLTDYNTPLLIGYNAAYRDIVTMNLQVEAWESKPLTAEKTFLISALSNTVSEIMAIAQYQDYTASANYAEAAHYAFEIVNGTTILVPDAAPSSTVWVRYRIVPADLVNPTPATGVGASSPLYLNAQQQIAIVYGGISELMFSQSDTDNGKLWEIRYQKAANSIRPLNRVRKVVPKYRY